MQELIVIRDLPSLQMLSDYVKDKEYIAFDTETTGTDKGSKIIGLSICAEEHKSFYVITHEWDTTSSELRPTDIVNDVFSFLSGLLDKKLIAHNAVFDCAMIKDNYGIDLMPYVYCDTMVLSHLLDENRRHGLKELGASIFGDDAKAEQAEMKESVKKNGGSLTKDKYEMYKADSEILAKYGAKDALLTFSLFWLFTEQLYEQNLQDFFFEESMPLLRGPTYDLNTAGLRIDPVKLAALKRELETENLELKSFIYKEIDALVKETYPGTNRKSTFNIKSNNQLAWLLFAKLGNLFGALTDGGRVLCEKFQIRPPYSVSDKKVFIETCKNNNLVYYKYTKVDKDFLATLAPKYKWVEALLKYNKNLKLLNTYVEGIQKRAKYNIIYPNFIQIGTTSGRYSCKNPNFQNLPRDDKRIKSCVVSRPGMVFVGADYSQLEPRVFASVSQDETLMACFAKGEDFYSVVGAPIFGITGCSMIKDDKDSFASKYKKYRDIAKQFALATPYGTSAFQQSQKLKLPKEECQSIIDKYFEAYPKVELMMLTSHETAKKDGVVYTLFGRPRHIPDAISIPKIYKNTPHAELPYAARTLLNLAMNHRVQGSSASIMNRAAIALHRMLREAEIDAKIVMQVHDELIVECLETDAKDVADLLQYAMENTTKLPGVDLQAKPVISSNLGDLK